MGDKTLIFRMCDSEMYTAMSKSSKNDVIDRGMALHKMIRLASATMGGEGYLNFMGNEFGHPEWIDFPREGNGWSYFYCRRQWSLADDPSLRYGLLQAFDREMLSLIKARHLLTHPVHCLFIDAGCQVLTYERGGVTFALNFSPWNSYGDYWLTVPGPGRYRVVLSTDEAAFGGFDRVSTDYVYAARKQRDGSYKIRIYLPARTAVCLKRVYR